MKSLHEREWSDKKRSSDRTENGKCVMLSLRIFGESKASSMYFFAFSILRIGVWKQTFSPGKDERYRLTFDWRFNTLSQSEIRVHCWTHNSKNLTHLGRREFNSTLHQSSHGLATRVHGFSTKTKSLAREIPPATQANIKGTCHSVRIIQVSVLSGL